MIWVLRFVKTSVAHSSYAKYDSFRYSVFPCGASQLMLSQKMEGVIYG